MDAARSATLNQAYQRIRTGTLTQTAAGMFGGLVGALFWQLWQSRPPDFTTFVAAFGVLFGAFLTTALDALTAQRTRRRHFALYVIGVVIGAIVMAIALGQGWIESLPPTTPAGSPSPSPS